MDDEDMCPNCVTPWKCNGPHEFPETPEYDFSEQDEILYAFTELLRAATVDGGRKRAAGKKVPWKVDTGHLDALHRHLGRTYLDPGGRDSDSGASHWVAVAWRALALAWQEDHPDEMKKEWRKLGYGA